MSIDVEKVREDTLGCKTVQHFNNAGSSLMPRPVASALKDFLASEEKIGGYETAAAYAEKLDQVYTSGARLLNCSPSEIAFLENATRAWQMAFYSIPFAAGDRILTSIAEYGSNVIAYRQLAHRLGVEIVHVPNDLEGQLDCDAMKALIDDRVKLIAISHIPTGGGLVNPVAAIGRIANDAGIPFLLDACQSAGHIPLDVEAIGCDFLSLTGRKYLRGPRATGLLYVRKSRLNSMEPVFLDQHAADLVSPTEYVLREDAKRFENWEQHFAGKYGLGVAIDYALDIGLEDIRDRIYLLASQLRSELFSTPGITLTDEGAEKCGIVTFISEKQSAEAIKSLMSSHGINVSVSDGSGTLVSFQKRSLTAVVRASLHYFNSESEVHRFISVLTG